MNESKILGRYSPIFLGASTTPLFNRFAAKAIDALIVVAVFLLGKAAWFLFGLGLAVLYCSLADGLGGGQSVGKKIMGLRVIEDPTGLPCSLRGSFVRNLPFLLGVVFASAPVLWILWVLAALPALGLEVYLLFTIDTGVRLGDVLANTLVTEWVDESAAALNPE